MVRRSGTSFVEVLVALAVLAILGLALYRLVSGGVRGSERATEMQLASLMGARVVDRLLAEGYPNLARLSGKPGELDLAKMEESAEQSPATTGVLLSDGFEYRAHYWVEEKCAGLVAMRVTLTWEHRPASTLSPGGSIALLRYLADPKLAMASREAFAR